MRPFRFIEHTGDLGVSVRGETLEGLFTNAAAALFSALVDRRRIRSRESREIRVEAPGREALLVGWLNEFLYLFDTQGMLFGRFEVRALDHRHLRGIAWGEVADEGRHPIKTLIKAVTFHQLMIRRAQGRWQARIILDI